MFSMHKEGPISAENAHQRSASNSLEGGLGPMGAMF